MNKMINRIKHFRLSNRALFASLIVGGLGILVLFIGVILYSTKSVDELRESVIDNNFKAYQLPTLNFETVAYATELENKTKVYDSEGNEVGISLNIVKEGNGTRVEVSDAQQFTPGKYKVEIIDVSGKKIEQDFTWGVLAINPNKSIYSPNETANLAMAVLDEKGKMVCDGEVELTIRNPFGFSTTLSTKDKTIIVNPECSQKKYTEKPDFEANYKLGGEGVYELNLTAKTKNGTYSIKDFMVVGKPDFDVERKTGTRIFPYSTYPVEITIKANRDFNGLITEKMSTDIKVKPLDGVMKYSSEKTDNGVRQLSWKLNIKKGQTIKIGYSFDAPLVSPQFYLLGPLSFTQDNQIVFEETRQWQLAIDDISYSNMISSVPGVTSYWRLGETSGNAQDSIAGGNSGTYSGGYTQNVSGGINGDSNTAVSFTRASSGLLTVADENRLDVGDTFSIEFWYKRNSISNTMVVFQKGTSGTSPQIWFSSTNNIKFTEGTGSTVVQALSSAYSGSNDTSNWHHVVVTKDGSTARIYVDGVDVTDIGSNITFTNNASDMTIGGPSNYFDGKLDEFVVYNRALSASEVKVHYAVGMAQSGYSGKVLGTSGLVAYWRLGESSGNISSEVGSFTLTNGGTPTYSLSGLIYNDSNTAISFNGTDARFYSYSLGAGLPMGTSPRTAMGWFKTTSTSTNQQIFGYGYTTSSGDYSMGLNNGRCYYLDHAQTNTFDSTGTQYNDGLPHFMAMVFDGSTIKCYIDGQKIGNDYTPGTALNTSGTDLNIGVWSDWFNGTIDEVSVFNRALTSVEINKLYNSGIQAPPVKSPYYDNAILNTSGLLAYWPLDDTAGGFRDLSGSGRDATISGTPTFRQTGAFTNNFGSDYSVKFDMTQDFGVVPQSAFSLSDGPFSIEVWAKRQDLDTQSYYWMFGNRPGAGTPGWYVGFNATGQFVGYDNASTYWYQSSETFEDTNWHHFVITKNGSTRTAYADGVLLTNSAANQTLADYLEWGIGAAGKHGSNSFDGYLEKMAVYGKVLSFAEVANHYSMGTQKYTSNYFDKVMGTNGLVGYWRLDETSGSIAYAAVGENGTYYNTPTLNQTGLVSGDSDTSVYLDGASVEKMQTTLTAGGSTVGYSAEMWVNLDTLSYDNWYRLMSWGRYTSSEYGWLLTYRHFDATTYGFNLNWYDGSTTSSTNLYSTTQGAFLENGPHHLVVVHDYANKLIHFYVDGKEFPGSPVDVSARGVPGAIPASREVTVGMWYGNSLNPMYGYIDEPAIYNSLLDAETVKQHYYAGAPSYKQSILKTNGLLGYWRLGEASGTTLFDAFGSHNGTYNGGYTLGEAGAITGDSDTSFRSNGTTGYGKVGNDSSNDFPLGSGAYSLELWFKRTATQGVTYQYLWSKSNQGGLWFDSTNKLGWDNDATVIANSSGAITDLNWHHVVVTHAASATTVHIYLDGVDVTVNGSAASTSDTNNSFYIGQYRSGGSNYFPGNIDEVAYYNKELTQAQVKAHYYVGKKSGPAMMIDGGIKMNGLIMQ